MSLLTILLLGLLLLGLRIGVAARCRPLHSCQPILPMFTALRCTAAAADAALCCALCITAACILEPVACLHLDTCKRQASLPVQLDVVPQPVQPARLFSQADQGSWVQVARHCAAKPAGASTQLQKLQARPGQAKLVGGSREVGC